jgi:hypothetical protein
MGNLGYDSNGKELEAGYYICDTDRRIIQLRNDAAGLRLEIDGNPVNIFDGNRYGGSYRPATQEELRREIENCRRRIGWLEDGLDIGGVSVNP